MLSSFLYKRNHTLTTSLHQFSINRIIKLHLASNPLVLMPYDTDLCSAERCTYFAGSEFNQESAHSLPDAQLHCLRSPDGESLPRTLKPSSPAKGKRCVSIITIPIIKWIVAVGGAVRFTGIHVEWRKDDGTLLQKADFIQMKKGNIPGCSIVWRIVCTGTLELL